MLGRPMAIRSTINIGPATMSYKTIEVVTVATLFSRYPKIPIAFFPKSCSDPRIPSH